MANRTYALATAPGLFASGLAGTVGVTIKDSALATVQARTTAGISEDPAGSAIYVFATTLDDTKAYHVTWDDGGGNYANQTLPSQPQGVSQSLLDALARIEAATSLLTPSTKIVSVQTTESELNLLRGDTALVNLSLRRSFAGWFRVWVTGKALTDDPDTAAIFQVVLSNPAAGGDGLVRFLGAAGTLAQGRLLVDANSEAITLRIEKEATVNLPSVVGGRWDAQALIGTDTVTIGSGTFRTQKDVTLAIA